MNALLISLILMAPPGAFSASTVTPNVEYKISLSQEKVVVITVPRAGIKLTYPPIKKREFMVRDPGPLWTGPTLIKNLFYRVRGGEGQ